MPARIAAVLRRALARRPFAATLDYVGLVVLGSILQHRRWSFVAVAVDRFEAASGPAAAGARNFPRQRVGRFGCV